MPSQPEELSRIFHQVDFTAIARVSPLIQFVSITASKLKAESFQRFGGIALGQVNIRHSAEVASQEPGELAFLTSFEAIGNSADGNVLLRVTASFLLIYKSALNQKIDNDDAKEFASGNATHTAWPYWREYLSSTTARMGYPAFYVPVLIVTPKVQQQNAVKTKKTSPKTEHSADP